jgi:hypothetical protein
MHQTAEKSQKHDDHQAYYEPLVDRVIQTLSVKHIRGQIEEGQV